MIALNLKLQPGILVLLCLFNCALLLHLTSNHWYYHKSTLVVLLMLFIQYRNYRIWWPTAISIIACCIIFLPKVPRVANHLNLEIGTGLVILGFILYKCLGFKTRISHATITYTIRCVLITLYFIAGFHKLNSGFFNADGSCAVAVNSSLFGQNHTFSPLATRIAQFGTISVEMILPFGLLHFKLRKATICILVLFHSFLALRGFSNFSAFAVFMLAGSFIDLDKMNFDSIQKDLKIYIAACIAASLTAFVCIRLSGRSAVMQFCIGIIFSAGFVWFFKSLLIKEFSPRQVFRYSVVPVLATLLLLCWGMQVYAGLSTARSLNMYSNLITEKSRSNHYLIDTRKTKIWDFEEDFVTVVKLSDNAQWKYALPPDQCDIPLIEFKRMALQWSRNKKVSCTIIYRSKIISIPDLNKSTFSKCEWWHRFLSYRIIPKKGANPCMW